MSTNQYPVFEDGQTLTDAELNDLRSFLHGRDRLVGRLIGFGVNAGLGGTVVDNSVLGIGPGLGVDQAGEPLLLAEERLVALPPAADDTDFDFIDGAPGGFSVVLEATDSVEPAPECGEEGCAGHAELHTRGVALLVVAGRVAGTRMDFAGENLLQAVPLGLNKDSTPVGDFPELRDKIADRLTNGGRPLVREDLIAGLKTRSLAAGEAPGITGYKCGWLNMVLFAALDLLRVEALLRLSWDRAAARPAVVLGWLHLVDADWTFDCAYRHAWEPPRGFTDALLGGSCTDPAALYRNELEALLAGYAPPDPAPAGEVPEPTKCPRGSIRIGGRCIPIALPPEVVDPRWKEPWRVEELDPLGPIWNPPIDHVWKEPWKIYGTEPWDRFDDGVIGATDYIGRPADRVGEVLAGFIERQGGLADVKVLTADEVGGLAGYVPSGGFSPSDTIVFTKDSAGTVVAAGRVPAVRNTRLVGNALPAAVDAAKDAQRAATELKDLSVGFSARLGELDQQVEGLGGNLAALQGDFTTFKQTTNFPAIVDRVVAVEREVLQFEGFRTKLDVISGKVDVISRIREGGIVGPVVPPGPFRPGGDLPTSPGINRPLAEGVVEFAETAVEALRALSPDNANFQRHADAADKARERLVATLASPAAVAEQPEVANPTLEVLRSLRTLVKASGVDPAAGRRLDAQLRRLGGGNP